MANTVSTIKVNIYDYCILYLLNEEDKCFNEIFEILKKSCSNLTFDVIKKGLLRLQKNDFVMYRWEAVDSMSKKKVFVLCRDGRKYLATLEEIYNNYENAMNQIKWTFFCKLRSDENHDALEYLMYSIISKEKKVYVKDFVVKLEKLFFFCSKKTCIQRINRMHREGMLNYQWKESKSGPPRKYYSFTTKGELFFKNLNGIWSNSREIQSLVDGI